MSDVLDAPSRRELPINLVQIDADDFISQFDQFGQNRQFVASGTAVPSSHGCRKVMVWDMGVFGTGALPPAAPPAQSILSIDQSYHRYLEQGFISGLESAGAIQGQYWTAWSTLLKQLLENSPSRTSPQSSKAATLRVERLATIQGILGLPMRALADVLQISRQGLYKWLDSSRETTLHEQNSARLAAIERIALQWSEHSKMPLSAVGDVPVANGNTIVQMLVSSNLDESAITAAMQALAQSLNQRKPTRSQRMAAAGIKRKPLLRTISSDD